MDVRVERVALVAHYVNHILHTLAVAIEAAVLAVAPYVGHTGITPLMTQKHVLPSQLSAAHHVFALGECHQSAKQSKNSMKLSTARIKLAMTTKSPTESPPNAPIGHGEPI
jgi:hypothetical protein